MSRNKLLLFIITILLLANVVLLYFFFKGKDSTKKPSSRERRGISEQLKNEVGFNELQLQAYEQRRTIHMDEMKGLFEDLRQTKEIFFNTVKDTLAADSSIEQGANMIAERQKQIDLRTHAYFQGLRKLCTPEQLPRFDSLYQQVIKRMISSGRKPPAKRPGSDSLKKHN